MVAESVPHPITQRGYNRQDSYLVDEDRRFYLDCPRFHARRHGVRLLGYCLMAHPVPWGNRGQVCSRSPLSWNAPYTGNTHLPTRCNANRWLDRLRIVDLSPLGRASAVPGEELEKSDSLHEGNEK